MGRPVRDLTKEGPFGRLQAIKYLGRLKGVNAYFLCKCECGNTTEVKGTHLTSGNTKSCGCFCAENCSRQGRLYGGRNKTHNMSGSPELNSWAAMKRRCNDPAHPSYSDYGGRGITVCERWSDFLVFFADMGKRPEGTTLDRIDPDGNYDPSNCQWADQDEQHRHRRTTITFTCYGISLSLLEWSRITGINRKTLWSRKRLGWSDEMIVSTPMKG